MGKTLIRSTGRTELHRLCKYFNLKNLEYRKKLEPVQMKRNMEICMLLMKELGHVQNDTGTDKTRESL